MFTDPRPRRRNALAGTVAALLVASLTACGSDAPKASTPERTSSTAIADYTTTTKAEGTTKYPLTIDNCGYPQTFEQAPKKVLILNGASVAEVTSFIALGIQDRILASAQSYGAYDDPGMAAAVKKVPTGGLTSNENFDVPREQVLALKPDLVISAWSGGFDAKLGFATREELAKAGIRTWVPPMSCANGKAKPTAAEKAAYTGQSIESSFELLTDLGEIFDVPAKAESLVGDLRSRLDAVKKRVAGKPTKNVIVAYPGMSSTEVPAVFNYGITNDVIKYAGAVNPFATRPVEAMATLSREELASTPVDVLGLGVFTVGEKPADAANKLFAAYPQWTASKDSKYVVLGDGPYLGPSNIYAVEKIAEAVHPE